jgi:hypothetical protein
VHLNANERRIGLWQDFRQKLIHLPGLRRFRVDTLAGKIKYHRKENNINGVDGSSIKLVEYHSNITKIWLFSLKTMAGHGGCD